MTGDVPAFLETVDPRARGFPASWRDAAIRALFDTTIGGVSCPACARSFRRPADLRRMHCDHIMPFSRGGLTVWGNLQLLCASCNLRKHAKFEPAAARVPCHPGQALEQSPGLVRTS